MVAHPADHHFVSLRRAAHLYQQFGARASVVPSDLILHARTLPDLRLLSCRRKRLG